MELSCSEVPFGRMEAVSELSPVSELSSCMRGLLCQDSLSESGVSPSRQLAVTPELNSPERNQRDQRGQLPETPTVSRRRAQSKLSPPQRPSLKLRWRRAGSLRGDVEGDEDDEDEKENTQRRKRVRVKLFSSSSPGAEEDEAVSRNKRQYHGSPGESSSHRSEVERPDPASVALFQRLRSRRKSAQSHIPDAALTDQRLIGDFSKQHVLPVDCVDHQDLRCVSAQTVAALIRGQFSSVVEDFLIIDCRYPYEYEGGHIKGAVNLYTEAQIHQAFLHSFTIFQTSPEAPRDPCSPGGAFPLGVQGLGSGGGTWTSAAVGEVKDGGSSPRKLIVFHCEFSSERGPRLCQYLRELDRVVNAQAYPLLLYPELYLLQGGYKHFYTCCPELCEPCAYVPMRHRDFREQLQRFSRNKRSHHRRRPIRAQQRTARF
ncbi:cell division cycle 25 homolog d isoform X1 [Pygocentrus nattereri]|uniref:cell division cycle 25 homolog d isoform X1 n=2 Tax=Pygocentrus nattereri TaxID=42514 RepID=UPI000814775A|nr:cell division cycle 25 homolog d isoform X1 [Pygocentrus nattereri]